MAGDRHPAKIRWDAEHADSERRREQKRRWDREHYFRANDPGRSAKLSPMEIDRIVRLRRSGYTVAEIVDITGVSKTTVSRYTAGQCRER
jgi:DNA invertase Pin-like site-specific DNA recombinase